MSGKKEIYRGTIRKIEPKSIDTHSGQNTKLNIHVSFSSGVKDAKLVIECTMPNIVKIKDGEELKNEVSLPLGLILGKKKIEHDIAFQLIGNQDILELPIDQQDPGIEIYVEDAKGSKITPSRTVDTIVRS